MVVKIVQDVTTEHLFWYYASSIGGLCTLIILLLLLIHIIYNYIKHFHQSLHIKLVDIHQRILSLIHRNDDDEDIITTPNLDGDPSNPLKMDMDENANKESDLPLRVKLYAINSNSNRLSPSSAPHRNAPSFSRNSTSTKPRLSNRRSGGNTKTKKPTNRIIFILMFGYLISGIIASVIFGFIRNNILWSMGDDSQSIYTSWFCGFGYFGGYIMRAFEKTFLYYLLLYRIKIVFKDCAYNLLPAKLYKFLCIAWIPFVTVAVILVVLGKVSKIVFDAEGDNRILWLLHYHESSGMLYCGGDPNLGIFLIIILVFITCSELIFFATLLVIFLKNLCSLQNALMQQYMTESNRLKQFELMMANNNMMAMSDDYHDHEISIMNNSMQTESPKHYKDTPSLTVLSVTKTELSFKEIISEYKNADTSSQKDSIQRIIILHKLAKKQAILASIAILSSELYWLASFISTKIALCASWDILINSICVWLMFGCSHKYWKIFTKYCCCYICYNKLNKIDKIIKTEKMEEERENGDQWREDRKTFNGLQQKQTSAQSCNSTQEN